jgi:hypothetical protein
VFLGSRIFLPGAWQHPCELRLANGITSLEGNGLRPIPDAIVAIQDRERIRQIFHLDYGRGNSILFHTT